MTSEERFKELWDLRFKYLGIGGLMTYEDFSKDIWLEATRQAYEVAAEIVEDRGGINPSAGTTKIGYHAIDPKLTAEAIRRLKDIK